MFKKVFMAGVFAGAALVGVSIVAARAVTKHFGEDGMFGLCHDGGFQPEDVCTFDGECYDCPEFEACIERSGDAEDAELAAMMPEPPGDDVTLREAFAGCSSEEA